MKKIINGKLYDTEVAKEVGSINYSTFLAEQRLFFLNADIYLKTNGEWFLCGKGNCIYPYDVDSPYGEVPGGYIIYPLKIDEAKLLIEKFMDAEVYIQYFGVVEE